MGTKRALARPVAEIASSLPSGPMLDAFSGMCAVGEAVAPTRQVWTNDFLIFPALVGRALFTSRTGSPDRSAAEEALSIPFRRNLESLENRFKKALELEERLIARPTVRGANDLLRLPYTATDPRLASERARLARAPDTFPYRLASLTYPGTYFGLRQCIEIDSVRYAIEVSSRAGEIDRYERTWLLLALCRAASLINSSSGQFAEYIKPTRSNLDRLIQKRKRSIWEQFLSALPLAGPIGTLAWRTRNRAFRSDSAALLKRLPARTLRPAIVYADPPYSRAQYSRYYHVLDVLIAYDYPRVASIGRYPSKRRQSAFGLAAHVERSMRQLISSCASLGAFLILSYPSNGLLVQQGVKLLPLLREYYRRAELVHRTRRTHSSFGGSAANPTVPVTENIYLGRP